MVTVRARIIRIGFILGLLAVLVSWTALEPQQAMARPVYTGGPDGNRTETAIRPVTTSRARHQSRQP